jgi:hypothetical protein
MRQFVATIRSVAPGGLILASTLVITLGCVFVACTNSLHRTCFVTGWVLFAAITTAFTRRFLRLRAGQNPERWVGQQTAIAVAIVTLFMMHVEFSRPNGWLDGILAGLFLVVAGTGAVGVVLWTQLRTGSIAATFETPDSGHALAHAGIRDRADSALERAGVVGADGSLDLIRKSFARRPRLWRRVLWNNELARTLGALESLKAQAEIADTEAFDTLTTLAIEKDRLDALRAGDVAVRRWLLVYMPSVACLLALGAMHGVIAHAHGLLAHVMLGK